MDLRNTVLFTLLTIPGILVGFTFHEYAHAFVADKLGDKTPRFQGRLTLNPLAHIEPIGFVLAIIWKFGWAKPVQTNPSAYKNYHKDDLKVSLAGPITNFLVAIAAALILGIYKNFAITILPADLYQIVYLMIYYIILLNVNLGLFNLIPVPGLDGFSIFRDLFPNQFYRFEERYYQYQMFIMLILIFVGGRIISIPANIILNMLLRISNSF